MSTNLVSFDERTHPESVRQEFATWCACPPEVRTPPTLAEFCAKHRLHRSTAWRWRADPQFARLVGARIAGWYLPEMPAVVQSLVNRAKEGSSKHAEILIRFVLPIFRTEDDGEDRADAAQALIAAVTSTDFGRLAVARMEALQRQRHRQAVDAEAQIVPESGDVQDVEILEEGEGDEQRD